MGPDNFPHLTCLESILDCTDTFLSPFSQIIQKTNLKVFQTRWFPHIAILPVLPTCLLCVCLSGSVYCEEVSPEMSTVPSLPKETAYLYARFNKIRKINNGDFADMGKYKFFQLWTNLTLLQWMTPVKLCFVLFFSCLATLRRIDLTGNVISEIDDGAFSKLHNLEELILEENRLTKLPMLPTKLVSFNANNNKLRTQGVKANAFKVSCLHLKIFLHILTFFYFDILWLVSRTHICDLLLQKLTRLAYLYLGNNELTAVPQLPESLHVVHLHVSWSMITIIRVGLSVICQKHYFLALVSCVCSAE